MHQTLHIFRKDLRHLWPEILANVTLTICFVWLYPFSQYTPDAVTGRHILAYDQLRTLSALIKCLLPVSWFLLIFRSVHSENLIGSKQFWLTKPYVWYQLLAAKVIFVVVCIMVPFALSHADILWRAGLPVPHFVPGILHHLGIVTLLFLLPSFALATLTATLLRAIGTLLAIIAALATVAFFLRPVTVSSLQLPGAGYHFLALFALLCLTTILFQYASRRVWRARIAVSIVAISLVTISLGPFEPRLLPLYYPPRPPADFQINVQHSETLHIVRYPRNEISVSFSANLAGIPANARIAAEDLRITLTTPDGAQHSERWATQPSEMISPGEPMKVLASLSDSIPQLPADSKVKVAGDVAFTLFLPGSAQTIQLPIDSRQFWLPGVGACTVVRSGNTTFACHTPSTRDPEVIFGTVDTLFPCENALSSLRDPRPVSVTLLHPSYQEDFGLDPYSRRDFYLSDSTSDGGIDKVPPTRGICPGALITVTPYRARRFQAHFADSGHAITQAEFHGPY